MAQKPVTDADLQRSYKVWQESGQNNMRVARGPQGRCNRGLGKGKVVH